MADDEIPPPRVARIADAVDDIEENVTRLRSLQSLSHGEYTDSDAQDRRDAVERKFEKLAEATLDIATELCKQETGSVPDRRKQRITVLENAGIVDADLADRLRAAIAFRDVLAHTYGAIVNDDLVYDALQSDLQRYVEFVRAIDEYLERTAEPEDP